MQIANLTTDHKGGTFNFTCMEIYTCIENLRRFLCVAVVDIVHEIVSKVPPQISPHSLQNVWT